MTDSEIIRAALQQHNVPMLELHSGGAYNNYDRIVFTSYSNEFSEGDNVILDSTGLGAYRVESVIDVTDDDEREEGLSYEKYELIKV